MTKLRIIYDGVDKTTIITNCTRLGLKAEGEVFLTIKNHDYTDVVKLVESTEELFNVKRDSELPTHNGFITFTLPIDAENFKRFLDVVLVKA
jgi:hypothetical protein